VIVADVHFAISFFVVARFNPLHPCRNRSR